MPETANSKPDVNPYSLLVGRKFTAFREVQGLTVQEVAEQLNLDTWIIENMEAGIYENKNESVRSGETKYLLFLSTLHSLFNLWVNTNPDTGESYTNKKNFPDVLSRPQEDFMHLNLPILPETDVIKKSHAALKSFILEKISFPELEPDKPFISQLIYLHKCHIKRAFVVNTIPSGCFLVLLPAGNLFYAFKFPNFKDAQDSFNSLFQEFGYVNLERTNWSGCVTIDSDYYDLILKSIDKSKSICLKEYHRQNEENSIIQSKKAYSDTQDKKAASFSGVMMAS